MYRTKTCGELRLANTGEKVTLAGWVQSIHNLGALTFVDLRDRYGITQLAFNEDAPEELRQQAGRLGREFVIQAKGNCHCWASAMVHNSSRIISVAR